MTKRITESEYIQRLSQINPTIEMLLPYNGFTQRGDFRCKKCGYEWKGTRRLYTIIRSSINLPPGCPKCTNLRSLSKGRITKQKAQERLDEAFNGNLLIVGDYNGWDTKCMVECRECGYKWESVIRNIYQRKNGNGCIECNKKRNSARRRYSLSDIERVLGSNMMGVEICDYDEANHIITFQCRDCGEKFQRKYNFSLKRGPIKCNVCYSHMSSGEYFIYRVLEFNEIEFIKEKSFVNKIGSQQRLDFYLPKFNMALEIQGDQHFNKKNGFYRDDIVFRDKYKRDWCAENGINLYYLYPRGDLFDQLDAVLDIPISRPADEYMINKESEFSEVIQYLKDGHNKKETMDRFGIGVKKVDRFIKTAGYKNYFDLYHKTRMEKLNLTDEKIIEWLKHNHFSHIERELGITKKYVVNHIFNNPDYPYQNTFDIKVEAVKSDEFKEYLEDHSIRDTQKYFMTDEETINKIFGTDSWKQYRRRRAS